MIMNNHYHQAIAVWWFSLGGEIRVYLPRQLKIESYTVALAA